MAEKICNEFLSGNADQKDTLGINLQKPKFPQYAVLSKRVDSFKAWPEYLPLKPDVLVEAGLVYTGVGDSVRCYHCGGGLRNWEEGDSPFEEHAKWYPTCQHVLLVKGQNYVDTLLRGEKPETDDVSTSAASVKPNIDDLMNSPAAQSCIQMGFKENLVKKAIQKYCGLYNNTEFAASQICEILFEMDEESSSEVKKVASNTTKANYEQKNTANTAQVGRQAPINLKRKREENDTVSKKYRECGIQERNPRDAPSVRPKVKENVEHVMTTVSDENQSSDSDSEDLAGLLAENNRLKERKMCKICMDDITSIVFLPCGHMVSCQQCGPAVNKCPICRISVKGYVKAQFAEL